MILILQVGSTCFLLRHPQRLRMHVKRRVLYLHTSAYISSCFLSRHSAPRHACETTHTLPTYVSSCFLSRHPQRLRNDARVLYLHTSAYISSCFLSRHTAPPHACETTHTLPTYVSSCFLSRHPQRLRMHAKRRVLYLHTSAYISSCFISRHPQRLRMHVKYPHTSTGHRV
jgi:hypothetical protein